MSNIFEFPKFNIVPPEFRLEEGQARTYYLPYVAMAFCRAIQEGDLEKAAALYGRMDYSVQTGDDELYVEDLPWIHEYIASNNELAVLFYNRDEAKDDENGN